LAAEDVPGDDPASTPATVADPAHSHDMSVKCEGMGVVFTAWDSAASPTTAGNYCLAADVTLTDGWTVPTGEVNLCLNGHKLTLGGSSTGPSRTSSIIVGSGCTLNICNCTGEGVITCKANTALSVDGGTTSLYGGTVESTCAWTAEGTAVAVNSGTFHLYGGRLAADDCALRVFPDGLAYLSGKPALDGGYCDIEVGDKTLAGGTVYAYSEDDHSDVYSGDKLTVDIPKGLSDNTVVIYGVADAGSFTLGSSRSDYELLESGGNLAIRAHTFGGWQYDGANHWKKCSTCEYRTDESLHCFEGMTDADCRDCLYSFLREKREKVHKKKSVEAKFRQTSFCLYMCCSLQ